jgi:hypothetical protein
MTVHNRDGRLQSIVGLPRPAAIVSLAYEPKTDYATTSDDACSPSRELQVWPREQIKDDRRRDEARDQEPIRRM